MRRYRSKTVSAWAAFALGAFGAHRFYLHGARDGLAWLHAVPTAAGLVGAVRLQTLGQDDRAAWLLLPLLGLMLSQSMLCAIVFALTPDERWNARHNPGHPVHPTGWAPVLAAIASLMVGGVVLTSTVAYAGQKFFEWQLGPETEPPGPQKR
ncbi:NINE protein [Rubrivivax gelatinosus]|uniref:TM2 domain-containing protein n=1 Tax=Rubrivivax gelatinosus (strain NBRC 100245 / IL144) TaxID=983917 RepID=I0HNU9_RUBGI|nr:NINE protein [Rubrivivax gelatinosus]BAL94686.1 hypothetical protein RGE_13450 [Rubrivivax gelatinosus IL144]